MLRIRSALLALFGVGLVAFGGCASSAQAPSIAAPAVSSPPAQQVATPAPAAPAPVTPEPGEYRLDSGDQIKITVFGEPDLSGTFQLDGTGVISMSLIGEIPAKNLSVRQLQREIESRLRNGIMRDPQVSAEVVNYRPYYILGEVNKPGQYPYTNGLTVMNAIASAGDFTYRADKRRIVVKSVDSTAERELELTPTTEVRPGDTIRVRQRLF